MTYMENAPSSQKKEKSFQRKPINSINDDEAVRKSVVAVL